jgi:hypothetical protein
LNARRSLVLALVALAAAMLSASTTSARVFTCQSGSEFAQLREQIADVLGACTSDVLPNPQNGDLLQATDQGLLVWRRLDRHAAFTNGATTWVDGPFGLQNRSNDARFTWESNPDNLGIVPPPQPAERCHTAGLALAPTPQGDAAVGHEGRYFTLTNMRDVPCTMFGYPGAQLLDAAGDPLPTSTVRGGGYLFHDEGPTSIVLSPGGAAQFGIEWVHLPVGAETTCPEAHALAVIPPDEYGPLSSPVAITACEEGRLHLTAVQPTAGAAPFNQAERVELALAPRLS